MKLTAILLLAGCLHVSATGNGQKVSIDVKNTSIKKVFKEVIRQSGFSIIYDAKLFENVPPITIRLSNATVEDVVKKCLEGLPYSYVMEGNTILVTAKPADKEPGIVSISPPIDVRGRVVNEKGEPVEGASVIVKGTKIGTSTNANGEFLLTGLDEDATLVISGVSVETVEVKLNGKEDLGSVATKTKIAMSEEVIVNAGYYKVKDKERTGNISRVDAKQIEKQPVMNPLQALQGRMPGVYIQQLSGVPGSGFNVQIRGRNSLRIDGNDPLYIVDGVPFTSTSIESNVGGTIVRGVSPFNSINPMDIESIEVLKDADATAIYGSRGSNGVVLITTKKGKAGKTKVDVNISQGFSKVAKMMKLLNTQQYLEMRNEAFANDGKVPANANYWENADIISWGATRNVDWQNLLIGGTAEQTNANVAISGGTKNTQFLVRGGYYRETTVFPGDFAYKRGSFHFNLTHQSDNQKLNMMFSSSYTADFNNLLSADLTRAALRLPPNAMGMYKSDGSINFDSTWDVTFGGNPAGGLLKKYEAKSKMYKANIDFSYRLLPELRVKSTFGLTTLRMNEYSTNPKKSQNPAWTPNIYAGFGSGSNDTWSIEPQAEYEQTIGKGKIDIIAGATFQEEIREKKWIIAYGYNSDALLPNIQAAGGLDILSNKHNQYRYTAFFGRLNYNWDGRYIINLTGRRDGSSRFGPRKQFANFGAVGAAWIFSTEKFIGDNLRFLSFGKLRASYGTSGSDRISDYGYLDSYSPITAYQTSSIVPTRIANPDFAWESNKKLEAGLTLGFVKDKINFEANWYRNRSSNQLVGQPLPAITGFTSFQANFPATIQNAGWELELKTLNFKKGNLMWTSSINVTIPKNKLIAYPGIEKSSYRNTYEVGKSLFAQKRWHYTGVDPLTGTYTLLDVDGNGGSMDDADLQAIKQVGTKIFGGFHNNITIKNFELDIFIQFTKQNSLNYLNYSAFGPPGFAMNQPVEVLNRWKKPGDITNIQRFTQDWGSQATNEYFNSQGSDRIISDASFIRLQNVSLAWQLSDKLVRSSKLGGVRIYLQGQNLLTISGNFVGLDPENSNPDVLPPLRRFTAGIQLTL